MVLLRCDVNGNSNASVGPAADPSSCRFHFHAAASRGVFTTWNAVKPPASCSRNSPRKQQRRRVSVPTAHIPPATNASQLPRSGRGWAAELPRHFDSDPVRDQNCRDTFVNARPAGTYDLLFYVVTRGAPEPHLPGGRSLLQRCSMLLPTTARVKKGARKQRATALGCRGPKGGKSDAVVCHAVPLANKIKSERSKRASTQVSSSRIISDGLLCFLQKINQVHREEASEVVHDSALRCIPRRKTAFRQTLQYNTTYVCTAVVLVHIHCSIPQP